MKRAALGVIVTLVTCLVVLGGGAASSRAQNLQSPRSGPPNGVGGFVCPQNTAPSITAAQQCPPLPTPIPTPAPRPTPPPTQNPPNPVLVPCGPGFVPIGQPCILPNANPILIPCGPGFIPLGQACFLPVQPSTAPVTIPGPLVTSPTAVATNPSVPGVTPPAPAAITISGQNPVTLTIHANQFLDLTHSVVINLAPGTEATGVQVSTGAVSIQGSQVVWNGFTLNTGQEATATVSLSATSGSVLTSGGSPVIQSVSLDALDARGNPVSFLSPGGGPTISQLGPSCANGSNPIVLSCSGAGNYSGPQFSVSGDWVLAWTFGLCPDDASTFAVSVFNPDGTQSQNSGVSQVSGGGFGSAPSQADGTYALGMVSPCAWVVQVQLP